jgi:putative tricarboxylic transport membrane protein
MRRDLVAAAALLGLAAIYYGLARNLGATALSDSVGPAGLPLAYAAALGGLGLVLGVVTLLRQESRVDPVGSPPDRGTRGIVYRIWRAAGSLTIGIAYLVLFALIGYVFATALAVAVMAIYQGERRPLRVVLVASIGAGVLFALFDLLLGVPMPMPWNG